MFWRSQSYELLPALAVRRGELRRHMRIATVSWIFGSAWMVLTSGVQIKSYARMLGFDDFQLGLLSAAPALASCFMIVAAVIIEGSGLRKYQFLYFGVVHRALWLALAVLPLVLPIPSTAAVAAMLGIVGASWIFNAFAAPAWVTWMGDMVPRRVRGRFFAARSQVGRTVQIVLVIATACLLDWATADVRGPDGKVLETAAAQPRLLALIAGMFAVAAVAGVIEIVEYRRLREIIPPPGTADAETRRHGDAGKRHMVDARPEWSLPRGFRQVRSAMNECLGDPAFRRYAYYAFTIGFATSVPGMFFIVYTTEQLGFSKAAVQVLYMAFGTVMGVLGLKAWGILLDRWGCRLVLMLATGMTVFSVIPYFFSTPTTPCPAFVIDVVNLLARGVHLLTGWGSPVWLTAGMPVGAYLLIMISSVIGGIGWSGVMLGQNNMSVGFADTRGRSKFVAAATVVAGLGALLGAPIGGAIVTALERVNFEWRVGPFIWTRYHVTFAISGVGRLAAVLLLAGMSEPGAMRLRDMLRQIGRAVWTKVFKGERENGHK